VLEAVTKDSASSSISFFMGFSLRQYFPRIIPEKDCSDGFRSWSRAVFSLNENYAHQRCSVVRFFTALKRCIEHPPQTDRG